MIVVSSLRWHTLFSRMVCTVYATTTTGCRSGIVAQSGGNCCFKAAVNVTYAVCFIAVCYQQSQRWVAPQLVCLLRMMLLGNVGARRLCVVVLLCCLCACMNMCMYNSRMVTSSLPCTYTCSHRCESAYLLCCVSNAWHPLVLVSMPLAGTWHVPALNVPVTGVHKSRIQ